jgi:hypothetical protein
MSSSVEIPTSKDPLIQSLAEVALRAYDDPWIKQEVDSSVGLVAAFGDNEIARSIFWRQGIDRVAPRVDLGEISGQMNAGQREFCREATAAAMFAVRVGEGLADPALAKSFGQVAPLVYGLATELRENPATRIIGLYLAGRSDLSRSGSFMMQHLG